METQNISRTFGTQTVLSLPSSNGNGQDEREVTSMRIGKKFTNIVLAGDNKGRVSVYHLGRKMKEEKKAEKGGEKGGAEPVRLLQGHPYSLSVVSFDQPEALVGGLGFSSSATEESSCSSSLSCGCSSCSLTKVAKVWDLEYGRVVRTMREKVSLGERGKKREKERGEILFHPRAEVLGCGAGETVTLWDLRQRKKIDSIQSKDASPFSFSPCGRWVVYGERESVVSLWDMRMKKKIKEFANIWGEEGEREGERRREIGSFEFHPKKLVCCVGGIQGDRLSFLDLENFRVSSSVVFPSSLSSSSSYDCPSMMSYSPSGSKLFLSQQERILSLSTPANLTEDSSLFSSPILFDIQENEGQKGESVIWDVRSVDSNSFVCAVYDRNEKRARFCFGKEGEKEREKEGKEIEILEKEEERMDLLEDIKENSNDNIQKETEIKTEEEDQTQENKQQTKKKSEKKKTKPVSLSHQFRKTVSNSTISSSTTSCSSSSSSSSSPSPSLPTPSPPSPQQTSPKQTSPKQSSPKQTSPQQTSPQQTSSQQTSPQQTSPQQTSPQPSSPTTKKEEREGREEGEMEKRRGELVDGHDAVCSVLANRLRNLKIVRKIWNKGGSSRAEALNQVRKMNDAGTSIVLLKIFLLDPEHPEDILATETLAPLLSIIRDLCQNSDTETSVFGLSALATFLNTFGTHIKQNMRVKGREEKEERIVRVECGRVHSSLLGLKRQLRVDDMAKEKRRGRGAREVLEAYKILVC